MVAFIYPFLMLAVVGLITVAAVHVSALMGTTSLFEHLLRVLGPGVFVVFLPTIFVMNWLSRDFKQKDIWRAVLRGCPRWMHRAMWLIFGYAWLGFLVPLLYGGGNENPAHKAASLSGALVSST